MCLAMRLAICLAVLHRNDCAGGLIMRPIKQRYKSLALARNRKEAQEP
jgi:hypothetical protein